MERVLAIDPGYDRCGVAVVENTIHPALIASTCIITDKNETQAERLAVVFSSLQNLIEKWQPHAIALETLFFSVNKKTAIKVAEARGVAVAVAGLSELPLIELSPQAVKVAMTGAGNAGKEAVEKMVALTLHIDPKEKLDDEIDAIALGIAALGVLRMKKWQ